MGKQKDQAEAQVHHLENTVNELEQQLQEQQQKLINYQQMQDKQQEEYARSVAQCLYKSSYRFNWNTYITHVEECITPCVAVPQDAFRSSN